LQTPDLAGTNGAPDVAGLEQGMVPIAVTPDFFSYVISSSSLNYSLKKSNATDPYVTHILTRVALGVT
jgi:hypothetical protein